MGACKSCTGAWQQCKLLLLLPCGGRSREVRRARLRQQRGRARASVAPPPPEASADNPELMRQALETVAAAVDRMTTHVEQAQANSERGLHFISTQLEQQRAQLEVQNQQLQQQQVTTTALLHMVPEDQRPHFPDAGAEFFHIDG